MVERVKALLSICAVALLLVTPPLNERALPPSVNAPALLLKVSEAMLHAVSTLGVSRVVPARTIAAVPLLAGATPPTQFAAVLQLEFAPPPFQMKVAARPARAQQNTRSKIPAFRHPTLRGRIADRLVSTALSLGFTVSKPNTPMDRGLLRRSSSRKATHTVSKFDI